MPNDRNWLIDHTGIGVSDIVRSARFYEAALKPLGASVVACISRDMSSTNRENSDLAGVAFGIDFPMFWLDIFHPTGVKQQTAFRATTRVSVDAFYHEGLAAGGTDNGAPGQRSSGYYAAFLLDPDSNNIEAVFREQDE